MEVDSDMKTFTAVWQSSTRSESVWKTTERINAKNLTNGEHKMDSFLRPEGNILVLTLSATLYNDEYPTAYLLCSSKSSIPRNE